VLLLLAPVLLFAYLVYLFVYPLYRTPLSSLNGPPAPSWLYGNFGNFKQVSTMCNSAPVQGWTAKYGPNGIVRSLDMALYMWSLRDATCVLTLIYQMPCLWTIDPITIAHVFDNGYDYAKPLGGREAIARLIGRSTLQAAVYP